MKQVLLYSINAEHLANILNGLKTIEVRKRDLPQWAKDKLAKGEIVEGYGYCTKGKPCLYAFNGTYIIDGTDKGSWGNVLNGLVVVKFEVSGVGKIDNEPSYHDDWLKFGKQACLDEEQWYQYFTWSKDGGGYAHHLTNIQPVNMELGEFEVWYGGEESFYPLKRASQSFQSVWVKS